MVRKLLSNNRLRGGNHCVVLQNSISILSKQCISLKCQYAFAISGGLMGSSPVYFVPGGNSCNMAL